MRSAIIGHEAAHPSYTAIIQVQCHPLSLEIIDINSIILILLIKLKMLRRILLFLLILSFESFLRKGRFRRHSSSLRCYFFLFSLIYFNRYREFWQKHGQHLRILPTNEREHIFIYQSFLYDKKISSQLVEENSTKHRDGIKFVILFIANKNHWIHDGMHCMMENGDGDENLIGIRRMSAKKELISSLGICALDLFVLTCSTNKGNNYRIKGNSQFSVVMREPNYIGWRFPTKLQIKPSQPDQKPRQLVLCISRVFAFERWQLLMTALEAYRLFKVDLVVSHVQSALSSVFKMMEAYEREGLLSIRPGIRFPHSTEMPWDPNAETEFNGQILLAHECFYEFRESANFIGLIDWDDLLLPSRHFPTLPSAFAAVSNIYTDAAYFLVNKLEANFVERTKSPLKFNLRKLMEEGILAAPMYNDEKLVILPRRLRGFWMHHSRFLEPNFRPIQLLTNYSIMLHLANEERVEPGEFKMNFLKRFNITEMDRHSRTILAELRKQNVLSQLPRTQIYFNAIAECHSLIFSYYKSITRPTTSRCLSYSLCQLPKVNKPCMVARSGFHSALTRSGRHAVHIRRTSEFVESQKGCADAFGGI